MGADEDEGDARHSGRPLSPLASMRLRMYGRQVWSASGTQCGTISLHCTEYTTRPPIVTELRNFRNSDIISAARDIPGRAGVEGSSPPLLWYHHGYTRSGPYHWDIPLHSVESASRL